MDEITFIAALNKATTLVDGGWRITLDLSEHESDQIAKLVKNKTKTFQVAIIPINQRNYGKTNSI